jgi:hypothetical protein
MVGAQTSDEVNEAIRKAAYEALGSRKNVGRKS